MILRPRRGPVVGQVEVPGSKSLTNRALVIAALARGRSRLLGTQFSNDSRHLCKALADLGLTIETDEANSAIVVKGCDGQLPRVKKIPQLFVGLAGTAARFLPPFICAARGKARIDGEARMRERPMIELVTALRDQGSELSAENFPMDIIGHGIKGGEIHLDVTRSSQFASGMMIAAPYAAREVLVNFEGRERTPYIDMTAAMMQSFGGEIFREGNGWKIPCGGYQGREYSIEPDVSGAAYFFAAAALCGGKVTVAGLSRNSLQGDIAFLQVLKHMGCSFYEDPGGLTIEKDPSTALKGVDVDMNTFSDQALTLAAIAPWCSDPVVIRNIKHIRGQECDRIKAIVVNLRAMGINVEEREDGVTVHPGEPVSATIKTFGDHRVAMSFGVSSLKTAGLDIDDPDCVAKTFENYWQVLESVKDGHDT